MIKVGEKLPAATFLVPGADGPKPMTVDEIFAGKRVALFSVPGAFTPTCSARHLPSFRDKAGELKTKGVDLIACTAVNDVFVMGAWAKDQNAADAILMLADGSGDFVRALGLELDLVARGLGMRGQRFSMLVDDGVVKELNVEDGGEYKVSSAEYLLGQL